MIPFSTVGFMTAAPSVNTISYVGTGSVVAGTTSLAVPYPAGIVAGQMLMLSIASKLGDTVVSTPSGWTALFAASQGSGADGVDSGAVRCSVFTKQATGSESGNLTVTITGGNAAIGSIRSYGRTGGTWGVTVASADDVTPDTTWESGTIGAFPLAAGDMVIAVTAVNGNVTSFSPPTLTVPGLTGSPLALGNVSDAGTSNGNDCSIHIAQALIAAGSANSAITYAMAADAATANSPAGQNAFIRLRLT